MSYRLFHLLIQSHIYYGIFNEISPEFIPQFYNKNTDSGQNQNTVDKESTSLKEKEKCIFVV